MATNAAEFLIKLNQQVSGPAAIATGAMQTLAASALQAATGFDIAAGRFRNSAGQFQTASSVASGAFQGAMTKVGAAGKDAAQAINSVGSTVMALATGPLPNAQQAMTKLGQVMGETVTGAAHKLSEALAMLGPEGAAVGAAIEGLSMALAATIGNLSTMMGLAISMAERGKLLRDSFAGLAGSAAGGAAVQKMISDLNLPFATSQVNSWAASLVGAGVKGQALASQLKAIASAQAAGQAFGKNWGAAAEEFFSKMAMGGAATQKYLSEIQAGGRHGASALKAMGLSIDELGGQAKVAKMKAAELTAAVTAALQKRGKNPLADLARSWDVIAMRAQSGFRSIFSGLDGPVGKFMESVSKLFSAFNKGGFAIQILKPIATAVFSTLFEWASKALTAAYNGFLQLAIWGLKAYIATKPLRQAFGDLWTAVVQLGAALGIVGGKSSSLGVMKALAFVVAGAFTFVVYSLKAIVGAITFVVTGATRLIATIKGALSGIGAAGKGAGGNLVQGLVGGIISGIGAVTGAIGKLASGALAAFRGAFQMHSPSLLLRREGRENLAGAVAIGTDEGRPRVQKALANLRSGLGKGGGGEGAGPGRGGDYFDFRGAHFGGDLTEERLEGWLVRIFQKARRSFSEAETAPT